MASFKGDSCDDVSLASAPPISWSVDNLDLDFRHPQARAVRQLFVVTRDQNTCAYGLSKTL